MSLNGPAEPGPRLRVVAAPWASLYDLPVDAVVEEQDRYRILGLDSRLPAPVPDEWPRLVHEMDSQKPASMGSLLRCSGRPLRLQAVLLDIDAGKQVRLEHLREVADRLCILIDAMPLRRVGMPLLGCVHGDIEPDVFANVFAPRLRATQLETLYVLAGSNPDAALLRQLRTAFEPGYREPGDAE